MKRKIEKKEKTFLMINTRSRVSLRLQQSERETSNANEKENCAAQQIEKFPFKSIDPFVIVVLGFSPLLLRLLLVNEFFFLHLICLDYRYSQSINSTILLSLSLSLVHRLFV